MLVISTHNRMNVILIVICNERESRMIAPDSRTSDFALGNPLNLLFACALMMEYTNNQKRPVFVFK